MKNEGPDKYGGPVGFGRGKINATENAIPDERINLNKDSNLDVIPEVENATYLSRY